MASRLSIAARVGQTTSMNVALAVSMVARSVAIDGGVGPPDGSSFEAPSWQAESTANDARSTKVVESDVRIFPVFPTRVP